MLIQNYGLFWRRKDVNWGRSGSGNKGALLGRAAKKLRAEPIDFRDQQGVYVLHDDNFKVVYVGQTGTGEQRLFLRLRQHKRDHLSQRWSRFSWFGILPTKKSELDLNFKLQKPTVDFVLDHIEAILIAVSEPPLNLQRGRFGIAVHQYVQHSEETELEDDEEDDEEAED